MEHTLLRGGGGVHLQEHSVADGAQLRDVIGGGHRARHDPDEVILPDEDVVDTTHLQPTVTRYASAPPSMLYHKGIQNRVNIT